MDYRAQFIQAMTPHALAASQATGVDPRIIMAQSILETGYGRHAPGNNYFGIKAFGSQPGQSLATKEYGANGLYGTTSRFRTYDSMADSAQDYANFLKTNGRYQGLLNAKTFDDQISALGKSGYATDPNYANTVRSIALKMNLDPNAQPTQFAANTPAAPTAAPTATPPASVPQSTFPARPDFVTNNTFPAPATQMASPNFMGNPLQAAMGLLAQSVTPAPEIKMPAPQVHRGTFNGFGLLGNYYG